jgi:signal transduction histidine kinase
VSTGSLRRRVALVALPLLVISLAGSAAVVTIRYRHGLEQDLRNRLLAGVKAINGASADGVQMKLVMSALALQGIDTQLSDADPDPAATQREPLAPEVASTGQLLVVKMPLDDAFLRTGQLGRGSSFTVATLSASRANIDGAVRRLVVIEIAVALAAVAIAALLLLRGLRTALQPLAHVGAVAARIADGTHDERLRPDRPETELGRMAAAFDHMVDELEDSIARARRSESAMRRFLADASHELRTPIAALQATAETLLREQPDRPERDELEARVAGDAARLGRLVADLLDLARLEANERLAREPVDIGLVAARAVAEAAGHLPGTAVEVESCSGTPTRCRARCATSSTTRPPRQASPAACGSSSSATARTCSPASRTTVRALPPPSASGSSKGSCDSSRSGAPAPASASRSLAASRASTAET